LELLKIKMIDSESHDDNYDEKIEKMVTMTVAAAKGLVPLGQVALPLAQIAQSDLAPPEARDLAKALARILQGERDPIELAAELTPQMAEVLWEMLDQIEAPLPEPVEEVERAEISFEELVEKVAAACTGEVLLWQRLWDFTGELVADERLSPDVQALGRVLRKILAGERQKHVLEELSAEHRWAVEQLLDWLNEQAVEPPEA
jgi:hypothetical protein